MKELESKVEEEKAARALLEKKCSDLEAEAARARVNNNSHEDGGSTSSDNSKLNSDYSISSNSNGTGENALVDELRKVD